MLVSRSHAMLPRLLVHVIVSLHQLSAAIRLDSDRKASDVCLPDPDAICNWNLKIDEPETLEATHQTLSDDLIPNRGKPWGPGWLRHANEQKHRDARCRITKRTLLAMGDKRGTQNEDEGIATKMNMDDLPKVLDTKSIETFEVEAQAPTGPSGEPLVFVPNEDFVLDTAMKESREMGNQEVTMVNAAAGGHVCGGFWKGGRHALEEAICTATTLSAGLEKRCQSDEVNGLASAYMPSPNVLLTTNVKIFREGTMSMYKMLPSPVPVNVISLAMPNFNPRVQDTPQSKFESRPCCSENEGEESPYCEHLRLSWEAVLTAAVQAKNKVLVVTDVGCGVFYNDPTSVGFALGKALNKFVGETRGALRKVIFAGVKRGEKQAAERAFVAAKLAADNQCLPTFSRPFNAYLDKVQKRIDEFWEVEDQKPVPTEPETSVAAPETADMALADQEPEPVQKSSETAAPPQKKKQKAPETAVPPQTDLENLVSKLPTFVQNALKNLGVLTQLQNIIDSLQTTIKDLQRRLHLAERTHETDQELLAKERAKTEQAKEECKEAKAELKELRAGELEQESVGEEKMTEVEPQQEAGGLPGDVAQASDVKELPGDKGEAIDIKSTEASSTPSESEAPPAEVPQPAEVPSASKSGAKKNEPDVMELARQHVLPKAVEAADLARQHADKFQKFATPHLTQAADLLGRHLSPPAPVQDQAAKSQEPKETPKKEPDEQPSEKPKEKPSQ
eukprot:TRINITY_DN26084_c0_g1_i1.p1 TRINITY_DN26084_c0_g1~~TRINITY_DN26084_c0_g1_i1.p1  ORF type:complete len:733 (+),score=134.66 TRINITY_DN26084_c0_g1_i1:39-2237(+)